MELHHDEYLIKESSTRNNKKIFLEIKGTLCELCGYDKCNSSLVFHHVNPDEKEFRLAEIKIKFDTNVEKIMNELNKCQLLCQNCHQEIHIDRNRFEKFKEEIYKKSKSTKERQGKIDRTEVYELYKNGMKKADIARHFCASRGTITDILKKL
jgi:predicted HNH restriction endonuclease